MDPATLTATDLVALIRARKISATEATRATLARIERLNPGLNAIVQLREDGALKDAAAVDAALQRGEDPGPLAGVPVQVQSRSTSTSKALPPPTGCASRKA